MIKNDAPKNRSGFVSRFLWLCLLIVALLAGCSKITLSVSGRVTSGGSALQGVTVTLSGPSVHETTTDENGKYSFGDVEEGTYTLTPDLPGYTFNPSSRAVYLHGISAAAFDFDAGIDNRISAKNHTVYAKLDGTLWAWGKNDDGQLGDGTYTNRSVPVEISGVPNIKSVAAGYDHTVALTTDGKVYTWGNNSNGQLGDGTTTGHAAPAQIPDSDLSDIQAIDAGYKYTIALKSDGTIWTWGYNNKGQLGNNTQTDSYTPQQITILSDYKSVAVAAGYDHALCVLNGGTVWAWGNNDNGQIGNGKETDSLVPVQVGGITSALKVSAGNLYSLALLKEGTIRAWGANALGQLGDGTTDNRSTPYDILNLESAATISAGYDHAIARLTDGTVWTWGNNGNGQLGDNTTISRTTPQQVSSLSGAIAAAAGQNDTFALLRTDEAFWSWGGNDYGQLGDGTTSERWLPVSIQVE